MAIVYLDSVYGGLDGMRGNPDKPFGTAALAAAAALAGDAIYYTAGSADPANLPSTATGVTWVLAGTATTGHYLTFSPATGGSNVCEVTVTVNDAAGKTLAAVTNFDLWLSDAATGAGLTGTTASGAVTVKTSSGEVVGTLTTKKALRVQTLATGVFILSITDSAKTGFYVCGQLPGRPLNVSAALLTANYG